MESARSDTDTTLRVITPPSGWVVPSLRELWHSFDLVYFLAKRDVTIRYRQTAVGVLWAILQPILLTAIFAVFLGRLAKVPTDGTPYPLFALTGMTMWLFISSGISRCTESTVTSAPLISKVYFPRIAVPIAALLPSVVDFVAGFVVLIVVLLIAGEPLQPQILLAPV